VDKLNNKGAFSIIAALLVAVVLIAAVMTTYSTIRYSPVQDQPQILSAVDETNLALKQLLGFTVGYYGSVLKVTGNVTYAQQLAKNYLNSGLTNVAYIKPEWGLSLNTTDLKLSANWFTNQSYSQGSLQVTYDLNGLGISGITYNASSRLDVQIMNSSSPNQAQFKILTDNSEPLINLGANNIKFYRYSYGNLTWEFSLPTNIVSHGDGTYLVDLPSGVLSNSYVVQVEDTRGLSVLASSFSQFTSSLAWNATGFKTGVHYVDTVSANVVGAHSDFTAQQNGPDGNFDVLSEAASGTFFVDNNPSSYVLIGQTSNPSGTVTDLRNDDGSCMLLRSYPTGYSSSYNTIGYDSQNSATISSSNSLSWSHTTSSDNDRILLVSVDTFKNSGNPATITSITYDGIALTPVATALYSTNPQVRSYVYYLVNPSVGVKTINVNFQGSTSAIGGSVTYTNVNQTMPILVSNANMGSGTNQSAGVNALGTSPKVLFGHMGAYRTSSGYSVNDGQTTRWSQTSQQYKGFGSEKSVTNGYVSTSWNTTNTASWASIALLLQPTQVASVYSVGAEFTGLSNINNWNNIVWNIDASTTINGVSAIYQLYNYRTGQYVVVPGDGYLTDTLGASNTTKTQTIFSNPSDYRNSTGCWKIKVGVSQTTSIQYDLKIDLIRYRVNQTNYALNLEEQWINVNATNPRQDLCIKTGSMGSEPLSVQVLHGGLWQNLMTLAPNCFNNVSLAAYIDSQNLSIRFMGGNETNDCIPDTWNIDCTYIKDELDIKALLNLQESTFMLEVLQNGTMRWLGQNIQLTSQTLPIPPIPVKAIHVNQTISGVNQEVPFQIEDWGSNYQIPLGLTSNSTVFGNRQMIVFLLTNKVTDFTIWWNGSDTAAQTTLAFTNKYFTNDNTGTQTLTNGKVALQFGSFNVKATVAGTSTSSTATFMRINTEASTYGAGLSYVIHHGIVRDVVQQEAEWGKTNPPADDGGANNCPNLYSNIVIAFPANATYYTYQLRIMFINSTQARSISDLCPIQLITSLTPVHIQTENNTLAGLPILQNGTGTFLNSASGGWTPHHFSQFITDNGKGAGLMFTDNGNQKLYAFDSFPSSASMGAIKASNGLLELLPVSSPQVQFTFAYDVTWQGAVVTFDGTTPICSLYDGTTPMGLWLLAEYPPTLTIIAKT
jgi:hypothetical protein